MSSCRIKRSIKYAKFKFYENGIIPLILVVHTHSQINKNKCKVGGDLGLHFLSFCLKFQGVLRIIREIIRTTIL